MSNLTHRPLVSCLVSVSYCNFPKNTHTKKKTINTGDTLDPSSSSTFPPAFSFSSNVPEIRIKFLTTLSKVSATNLVYQKLCFSIAKLQKQMHFIQSTTFINGSGVSTVACLQLYRNVILKKQSWYCTVSHLSFLTQLVVILHFITA